MTDKALVYIPIDSKAGYVTGDVYQMKEDDHEVKVVGVGTHTETKERLVLFSNMDIGEKIDCLSMEDFKVKAKLVGKSEDVSKASVFAIMPEEMEGILPGRFYRHFKGEVYYVIGLGEKLDTKEKIVLYKAFEGDNTYWVRPLDMFKEKVYVDGNKVHRFALTEEGVRI